MANGKMLVLLIYFLAGKLPEVQSDWADAHTKFSLNANRLITEGHKLRFWQQFNKIYHQWMLDAIPGSIGTKPSCTKVSSFIEVEFFQQPLTHSYVNTKHIRSSSTFRRKYSEIVMAGKSSTEVTALKVLKFIRGLVSVGFHMESVNEDEYSSSKYEHNESTNERRYNTKFLQIIRKTTAFVTVDGSTAKATTKEMTNVRHVDSPFSDQELKKNAEDYVKYKFSNLEGSIQKNTYSANACI